MSKIVINPSSVIRNWKPMEYFLYRIFSHLFIIVLYSTLLLFLLNETKE